LPGTPSACRARSRLRSPSVGPPLWPRPQRLRRHLVAPRFEAFPGNAAPPKRFQRLGEGHVAKFVERYAEGRAVLEDAARRWADDVRAGRFPREEHTYAIAPEALAEVTRRLGRE
jgi:hypothetical protein